MAYLIGLAVSWSCGWSCGWMEKELVVQGERDRHQTLWISVSHHHLRGQFQLSDFEDELEIAPQYFSFCETCHL
ncbi:hypothetical protein MHYP_G00035540 [Metynnis hypsauchen]